MNELIDLKKIWIKAVALWKNNLASILACALFFFFGVSYGTKSIVDDCHFAKVFRDGNNVYSCDLRILR
jgi:hypothetical protein